MNFPARDAAAANGFNDTVLNLNALVEFFTTAWQGQCIAAVVVTGFAALIVVAIHEKKNGI